jgi:hypothetical protein
MKLRDRFKEASWKDYILSVVLICIVIALIIAPIHKVSALTETYKVNNPTNLQFTCTLNNAIPSASTIFNITITDRDGNYVVNNQRTTSKGNGAFNYTYTFTQPITYKVQMFCYDGTYSFSNEGFYNITPSGFADTFAFYLLICLIIVGIIALGYKAQEEWFIVIGGMLLMALGIYSINSGVAGFRDMFMTWGIGIIEIGIGFVLTIIAGLSKADIDITSESW